MRTRVPLATTLLVALCLSVPRFAQGTADSDVSAARRVFVANLSAIRDRDADAYLACYLRSPRLTRTGPTGFTQGYDSLAASMGGGDWPDHFEARDLRLVPVSPGVVYGTYRYRVRYGATEQAGLSERVFVQTPQGWRIAVSTAFPAPAGVSPPALALVGGTLVDGTGKPPLRDAVVVIRDGRIEAAGPRRGIRIPADAETTDARGTWITPGLIDAHVHFSQTGWFDGRPDALDLRSTHPYEETQRRLREHPEVFERSWLACGVTSVFDVGGYPWTVSRARDSESNLDGPRIAAAGPLLSTIDHPLNLPGERQMIHLRDSTSAADGVRYLKSLGANAVKVWFIVRAEDDFGALERVVSAAGAEARRAGLPLIVHATGLREAKAALRAGANLLVHGVSDRPLDAEFLSLAKRQGTLYCPTITVFGGYARGYRAAATGEAPEIDDPTSAVDSLTRAHVLGTARLARAEAGARSLVRRSRLDSLERLSRANTLAAFRAGIPIVLGTDAGNPLTLHGPAVFAELEALERSGLRPMDVLVAGTRNAARALGRGSDLGTVVPGRHADLLLLAADPTRSASAFRRIRSVVRGGELKSVAELSAAVRRSRE